MDNYIGYFRVSSKMQVRADQTSLGLESQKTAVRNYIGTNGVLVKEYVEIENYYSSEIDKSALAIQNHHFA